MIERTMSEPESVLPPGADNAQAGRIGAPCLITASVSARAGSEATTIVRMQAGAEMCELPRIE
jgi:hypothetical protein